MTVLLNEPCFIYYNGVTFPTETETVEIQAKPMPDSAGRTVAYVHYAITLHAIVYYQGQAQSTDSTMESLRVLLQQYGGEFHYENVGFGNLTINVEGNNSGQGASGPARDVLWGPKPQLLRWKPQGQVAADVTWTVEVAIPECMSGTNNYQFAFLEAVYQLEIDEDQSGYSTRTMSGHLRIPQTRASVGDRTLTDQADAYRERINPPLQPGFRRVPGTFTLSEDKCRLDFVIKDIEVGPNYPPQGVVEVSASHRLSTDKILGGIWNGTLQATYELSRVRDRSQAFKAFYALWQDRVNQYKGKTFTADNQTFPVTPIMKHLEIGEPEIYGRKCAAFNLTYTLSCDLKTIVSASGLWRPVPGNNWSLWSTSLQTDGPMAVRGNAGLKFNLDGDIIVDLCVGLNQQSSLSTGAPSQPAVLSTMQPQPTSLSSWLAYQSTAWLERHDETVELKTLPPTQQAVLTGGGTVPIGGGGGIQPGAMGRSAAAQASNPGGTIINNPIGGGGGGSFTSIPIMDPIGGTLDNNPLPPNWWFGGTFTSSTTAPPAVVQERARPSFYVHIAGWGARAGYGIVPPFISSCGGFPVVPANLPGHGARQWLAASWFSLPIIMSQWHLRYLVLGTPAQDQVMDSPFFGY